MGLSSRIPFPALPCFDSGNRGNAGRERSLEIGRVRTFFHGGTVSPTVLSCFQLTPAAFVSLTRSAPKYGLLHGSFIFCLHPRSFPAITGARRAGGEPSTRIGRPLALIGLVFQVQSQLRQDNELSPRMKLGAYRRLAAFSGFFCHTGWFVPSRAWEERVEIGPETKQGERS